MNRFENVHFHGVFRDYQQRVIDNSDKYLKDGKINIVAAPGSGKTVLGLELIRRLASPCIVLSPTTAIRQQWGERFKDLFLDDKDDFDALFSYDLHKVGLITSVTYQALYSAIEKKSADDENESDCSDIELFELLKKYGIKTICLDEAHHLKNEWQKALEKFIGSLDPHVKIISLTATPPYDSEGSEWSRYVSVCGEIDEEIFVPELVGQSTLCPHQDYVYFNYPTAEETAAFYEHKKRAAIAVQELAKLDLMTYVCHQLNNEKDYDKLFTSAKQYIALIILLRHCDFKINKKLVRELTANKALPSFNMAYAETGIQFLLDSDMISDDQKSEVITVLKNNLCYEKKRATLDLSERLKRSLISSVGKLDSIKEIAQSEISAMGDRLRMLVLTDYIKKENLSKIATQDNFSSINVVSIFETLRRADIKVSIGVLSGTLVILPKSVDLTDIKHKSADIPGTDYWSVEFIGSTHRAVDFVGKLFENGDIQILVGTKSLLGEGWDSPCINSLILASVVGSFVLSNQMRGRAIRIDKNDPDKTANIWHLVTVEPQYLFEEKTYDKIMAYVNRDVNELLSYDCEILKRRFDSFMGPNYSTGVVESGIERITAIKPPFDKEGIARINSDMLILSSKRSEVKEKWRGEVADGRFAVGVETEIPAQKRVPVFTFWNYSLVAICALAEIWFTQATINFFIKGNTQMSLLMAALIIAVLILCHKEIIKLFIHINPARSIKTLGVAVYKTLCECDLISQSAKVDVDFDKNLLFVSLRLRNASVHDQNVFNTAMTEMLTPIENPRYILISKNIFGRYDFVRSFACPSIIGKKKEYVSVLTEKLKNTTGNFEPFYTHREEGRKMILKCRKRSYISRNEREINKKFRVSHFE